MDLFEAIRNRRSVRKYLDKPVPWELVVNILEAAKYAPCAGNVFNWRFLVIKNEGNRKAITKACMDQDWMESAPMFIVVVAEPLKAERFYGTRGSRLYTLQGAAASIQNLLLAAHAQGLATCWVGAFDDEEIWRICKLSEETSVLAVITLGYPAEVPHMPPKHRIEHLAYFERWYGRIEFPKSYLGMWSLWNMQMVDAAKKQIGKFKDKVKDRAQRGSGKK